MMARRSYGPPALASALWLVSAPLAAQTPPPASQAAAPGTPTPAQRETARNLMDEGERLRIAGDLRGALTRFKAAHAILHIPTTGLQTARAHAGLGELVEARGLALEAANHATTPGEPSVFASARKQAADLANELAAKVPSMQVQVAPSEANYTLSIDGLAVPDASRNLPQRANPGVHDVLVEAPGCLATRRQVRLDEGQTQVLTFALSPQTQPTLMTAAGAAGDVSPQAAAQSVSATDPGTANSAIAAKRTRAYIGFGAGGAVLLTGIITGIVSATKTSGIKARCPGNMCPDEKDAISSANTFGNVANITIPLGLLGVGYGLYEFLTLPSTKDTSTASTGLHLDWEGTSATLRGSL